MPPEVLPQEVRCTRPLRLEKLAHHAQVMLSCREILVLHRTGTRVRSASSLQSSLARMGERDGYPALQDAFYEPHVHRKLAFAAFSQRVLTFHSGNDRVDGARRLWPPRLLVLLYRSFIPLRQLIVGNRWLVGSAKACAWWRAPVTVSVGRIAN